MSGPATTDPQDLQGSIIGSYRIVDRLGVGGMGAVYLGEHVSIGRRAAIKVLHPVFAAEPAAVERFFNEARAANMIKHQSIVDIYDWGQSEAVGAYLVMELLDGESLKQRLHRSGRLTPAVAARIIRRITLPLAVAHEQGIIHRDLKPANIFLLPDADHPDEERIKLLDFGIAKLTEASGRAGATHTGALFGTPLYMSPEQAHGAKHVDYRTDIYALGVIAYEMIAGRPPFHGGGYGAVIAKHLTKPPPPMSEGGVTVPADVEAAVQQALAKDPEERFSSVLAFGKALTAAAQPIDATIASGSVTLSGPGPASPSQPAPSQPAPSQPAPSQPAPARPAPSRPASSFPRTMLQTGPPTPSAAPRATPRTTPRTVRSVAPSLGPGSTVRTNAPVVGASPTPPPAQAPPRSRLPLVAAVVAGIVVLAGVAGAAVYLYRHRDADSGSGASGSGTAAGSTLVAANPAGGSGSTRGATPPGAGSGSAARPGSGSGVVASGTADAGDPGNAARPGSGSGVVASGTTEAGVPGGAARADGGAGKVAANTGPADAGTPDTRRRKRPRRKTFFQRLPRRVARAYRRRQYRRALTLAYNALRRRPRSKDLLTIVGMSACRVRGRALMIADKAYRRLRGARKRRVARACRRAGVPMD